MRAPTSHLGSTERNAHPTRTRAVCHKSQHALWARKGHRRVSSQRARATGANRVLSVGHHAVEAMLLLYARCCRNIDGRHTTRLVIHVDVSDVVCKWPRLRHQRVYSDVRKNHPATGYVPLRIVDERYRGQRKQYLVRWKGYPASEATWTPARELQGTQALNVWNAG